MATPTVDGAKQAAVAAFRTPKTILGFFSISIVSVLVATAMVIWAIAPIQTLQWLVPWVLAVAVAVVVSVLLGVLVTAWWDPTKLQLGIISGEVYVEHEKLTLADSDATNPTEFIDVRYVVVPDLITGVPKVDEQSEAL